MSRVGLLRVIFITLSLHAVLAEEEWQEITKVFKAGKLAIKADWNSGRVNSVEKGGQGELKGVQSGWYFDKVEGKEYSEALLDSYMEDINDYSVTFKVQGALPTKKKDDGEVPKPDFVFAEELMINSFQEKVKDVTNGSTDHEAVPYYPVVMFHVSWCKHCRAALPEYEEAAKMIDKGAKDGQFHPKSILPKFFVIECDQDAVYKALCNEYTGTNFPAIKLFRDGRTIHFNRPRLAQTFAWWAAHVSRPPVQTLSSAKDLKSVEQNQVPIFVLSAEESAAHEEWQEVALDYIEEHHLMRVESGSEAAKRIKGPPSVTVFGQKLDPLPFTGDYTRQELTQWVLFNQFEPVVEFRDWVAHPLKSSGFTVIAFVHSGTKTDADAVKVFKKKAKELRRGGKYLFTLVDATAEDAEYLEYVFPLVAPKVAPPPRIFAFFGKDTYWEDQSFTDPSTLTEKSIEALLANTEALQDGSSGAWFKRYRKTAFRFASSSPAALGGCIAITVFLSLLLRFCFKQIFGAEEKDEDQEQKGGKQKSKKTKKGD